MLALTTSVAEPHIDLTEVSDPQPAPSEALVAVKAFSLNRGEVKRLPSHPEGTIAGWDLARVVEPEAGGGRRPPGAPRPRGVGRGRAAGRGPAEGARVVGLVNTGAWAERAAVPTRTLAPLPDAVTD